MNSSGNMVYTTTPWTYSYPGNNTRDNVAWTSNNSGGIVQYVGEKPANSIGLYDMSGNVREWLSDWNYNPTKGEYYDPYCGYNTSNISGSLASDGSISSRSTISKKESKVLMKGGHFGKTDDAWVDSNGDKMSPSSKDKYTGFRICRNVTY